jgi:SAM-dependent methyltransferase
MPNPPPQTGAPEGKDRSRHLRITTPSPWLTRYRHLIRKDGRVLDLAAGGGRHGRSLLDHAGAVVFIDRDAQALGDLEADPKATVIEADLEIDISPFAPGGILAGERFDAVVVVNYLHRPLLDGIIDALNPGGVLIYETFARGNEVFSRPRNPDHLLMSGELLQHVAGRMQVVAYEHGIVEAADIPGVKQRLAAVKDVEGSARDDGEPPPHPLS